MGITGIICEYNPFHLGHQKQLDTVRELCGSDGGIVCLMSGNYVQRGVPAIFDKSLRARAAVLSGADLVLELPVTAALRSAEGFAGAGVSILSLFCDQLCFGAETGRKDTLMAAAEALLSPQFSPALHQQLDKGLSFPAARQAALQAMGLTGELLCLPNDILAVEYCKAILTQGSRLEPLPITRSGCYHDTAPDPKNPSASAVRKLICSSKDWHRYVPDTAADCFRSASLHTLAAGERAILSRLRTMQEEDFSRLPFGSEGLWRKLMHAARAEASLEAIVTSVKSRRYTRTRLDRMVLCAFLGLTEAQLQAPAPYVRVLAFNDRGREILKQARKAGSFPNAGETQAHPYQMLETRCGDLYGLFAQEAPEPAGTEAQRRVFYHKAD